MFLNNFNNNLNLKHIDKNQLYKYIFIEMFQVIKDINK